MAEYKIINIDPITRVVTLIPPIYPEKISGLEKLVQIVVMALLNSPGRSAMYPEQGAGLKDFIGQYNISITDPSEMLGEIAEKIEKIKEEILDNQNSLENDAPSERLADFIALSVDQGANIDQVVVKFRVISEAGDEANFAI